jgi:hypothetical protein
LRRLSATAELLLSPAPARSPWSALQPGVDPLRWAKLLRRAYDEGAGGGAEPSPILREVVARSWRRSATAGIDPDRPAPRMLDDAETARRLERHPLGEVLPLIAAMLSPAMRDSQSLAALSDADGLLLWADGHPAALRVAARPQFLPGALCSEQAIGTNAVGTALAIDHAVQIFSAEHFSRLLHGWTCAAAPIHDPDSGEQLGAIDVSGGFRTGHAHTLALVTAVARAAEAELHRRAAVREQRLKTLYLRRIESRATVRSALLSRGGRVLAQTRGSWMGGQTEVATGAPSVVLANGTELLIEPLGRREGYIAWPQDRPHERGGRRPLLTLETLGRTRVRASLDDRELELGARQGTILALLALHPEGLGSDALGVELYGRERNRVTVRAEVSRLRAQLGPLLRSSPYRLDARVHLDVVELERALRRGRLAAVVEQWRGGPLPGCDAPAIAALRGRLERAITSALEASPDPAVGERWRVR